MFREWAILLALCQETFVIDWEVGVIIEPVGDWVGQSFQYDGGSVEHEVSIDVPVQVWLDVSTGRVTKGQPGTVRARYVARVGVYGCRGGVCELWVGQTVERHSKVCHAYITMYECNILIKIPYIKRVSTTSTHII